MNFRFFILLLLFIPVRAHAQDFSSKKVQDLVDALQVKVTETPHTDQKNKNVRSSYTVYGKTLKKSSTPAANDAYEVFEKIRKTGKVKDFIQMARSENPALRVYGVWALAKKEKFEPAYALVKAELQKSTPVYWSLSDSQKAAYHSQNLMLKLIQDEKKAQIDAISGKNLKVFKGPVFTVKYPKNWKVFETKHFEKDVIFRIAPKNEIKKMYIIPTKTNSDGFITEATLLDVHKDKNSIKDAYRPFFGNPEYLTSFSPIQVNISAEQADTSLSTFIENRKEQIDRKANLIGVFNRISPYHYVNYLLEVPVDNGAKNSPAFTQIHTLHYYQYQNKRYTLVYSTTEEKNNKYWKEVGLILKNFSFNRPHTD